MNVAEPNEASSLAWLSVKRFCGEDAQLVKFEQVDVSLGRRHISRSEGFIPRVYRGKWKWSVEDEF